LLNLFYNSVFKQPAKPSIRGFFIFPLSILLIIIITTSGCTKVDKPVYDNPFDPINEDFILPKATIGTSTATPGATLHVTSITFHWTGSNSNSKYSYMLRGYDNAYSDWEEDISDAYYSYLDEGTYTFLVKEKYTDDIIQDKPDSLTFTIDAITDCALILRRWALNAGTGTSFSIYLDIENVSKFKGLKTYIDFSPGYCTLQNIEKINGSVEGADGILFISTPSDEANNTGRVEINIICLGAGAGFTGNGTICKLDFLSNDNTRYYININDVGTELRDVNNNTIELSMVRGTIVN
jgi:hypothetical protein